MVVAGDKENECTGEFKESYSDSTVASHAMARSRTVKKNSDCCADIRLWQSTHLTGSFPARMRKDAPAEVRCRVRVCEGRIIVGDFLSSQDISINHDISQRTITLTCLQLSLVPVPVISVWMGSCFIGNQVFHSTVIGCLSQLQSQYIVDSPIRPASAVPGLASPDLGLH